MACIWNILFFLVACHLCDALSLHLKLKLISTQHYKASVLLRSTIEGKQSFLLIRLFSVIVNINISYCVVIRKPWQILCNEIYLVIESSHYAAASYIINSRSSTFLSKTMINKQFLWKALKQTMGDIEEDRKLLN